jgi:hypothetical protein
MEPGRHAEVKAGVLFFPAARGLVPAQGFVCALGGFWAAVSMPGSGDVQEDGRDDRRDQA